MRTATIVLVVVGFASGCATRSRQVEEAMRIETNIERPLVLAASLTPALEPDGAAGMPREIVHVMGDVRFAAGSAELLPEARSQLDHFGGWLLTGGIEGDYIIEIQGHADATGSREQNLRLGRARAEAVRRYLRTKLPLPVERIEAVSAGERSPAAADRTPEGRSQNRRAVLLVLR